MLLFALILNSIEFIVADEDVLMETDINDFNGKMKVIKI